MRDANLRGVFACPWNRAIGYEAGVEAGAGKRRFDKLDVFEKVRPMKPKFCGNTHFWLER